MKKCGQRGQVTASISVGKAPAAMPASMASLLVRRLPSFVAEIGTASAVSSVRCSAWTTALEPNVAVAANWYGKPPEASRWQKGQSGNPKGRPKTRADHLKDAAAILSEPVTARTPDGKPVSLAGLEAAYLALCRKGLKGDIPALLRAITIMLEVQPAVEAKADARRQQREDLIARLERMGLPVESLRSRPPEGG